MSTSRFIIENSLWHGIIEKSLLIHLSDSFSNPLSLAWEKSGKSLMFLRGKLAHNFETFSELQNFCFSCHSYGEYPPDASPSASAKRAAIQFENFYNSIILWPMLALVKSRAEGKREGNPFERRFYAFCPSFASYL
jgi:hypothetical protein